MVSNTLYQEDLEREIRGKYQKREKKKRCRAKISGKEIFKLKNLIGKKGRIGCAK